MIAVCPPYHLRGAGDGAGHPADRRDQLGDRVLLCCFGPELAGPRHHKQLSTALQQAGYRGALAQHLIRLSPLLVRESGRHYRLKRCDETPS